MNKYEYKAARLVQIKNIAISISTVVLVLGLFYLSHSFWSLLGMSGFFFLSNTEIE